MRRAVSLLTLVLALGVSLLSQTAELTVVAAGPTGEIRQLQDANEIRLIFSEPMVALGRVPANPSPPWIRIQPAMKGAFRWSGTTILIFTPDPAAPLPHATRYVVTVSADAAAMSGRRLGKPFEFSFTTPTVRLESARWMRRNGRFDEPVQLALTFNQRVRPEDVVAHLGVRHQPHKIELPSFSAQERARLTARDPNALQQFDAKLAAARAAAGRSDAVAIRQAADWDRKRFPPSERLVVVETTTVPPPGAWLQLTLQATMPSPEGPERPPKPQVTTAELPRMFLVSDVYCQSECNPSGYNTVMFTEQVDAADFARTLTVADITDPAREQPVQKKTAVVAAGRDTSTAHNVEDGGFDRQPPAKTWALELDPSLRAVDGQTLGYRWIGIIENWHERAFTSFGDGHGVWEKSGGAQLPFYARNFLDVTQRVVRIAPNDLMARIRALREAHFELMPPGAGSARKLNVRPDEIQSHGLNLTSMLSAQGTGIFWAGIEQGTPIARSVPVPRETSTVIQVTNLGITVKDSPHSTLVFVTRLDNGAPVADARVTIVNTDSKELWRGTTAADGVALAPALTLRKPDEWYEFSFLVMAEKDGDVAYTGSDWNEGIVPWEFGKSYNLWEATNILRGSVFADRGVYKPGEAVQVKAIVRMDTASGIKMMPAGSTLDVRTYDARNKEVDRRTVTLSKWSSAEWSWTVPADATLGNYRVQATLPGTIKPEGNDVTERERDGDWLKQVSGQFLVAAYRRPDFRVDATLVADLAIAGAPLRATATARYLFGSAMGQRPVKWSVTRAPDYSIPAAILEKFPDDKFVFSYYQYRSGDDDGKVAGEDAVLDAGGQIVVPITTEKGIDRAYRYTFEADVEDVSRQHIANRASLTVHPAPWYIGLRRPSYFANTTTGTSVDVVAVNHDGTPAAGVTVELSLIRVQWNSIRRAEGSGFYTWETERLEIPAGTWTIKTTASPITQAIPVPEGGFYTLRATAQDAEGRRTRTETSFYGLGQGYTAWERFDHQRITIEPEKKTWKPGETARLMIQSPWESATALLTVEREGIRSHRQFALTSTQQTVTVPVTEADIPNVYVSVLLVRGRTSNDPGADGDDPGKPAFRLGYTELTVADESRVLALKVSADREEYRPANTAKVSVAVTDFTGKPAASEVTLWAVDYGVLSLTDYRVPDVARAVYQRKALQVMTTDSRQRVISRRVLTPKGASEGGGGGNEGAFRRDFRPLAFWLGSVETDRNGRATKEVTLPESLTTYRIMAVAGDTSSRFGSGNTEIRVSKPVTLLPAFPRFLALGDRATFGGVVTNTTTNGGQATVTMRSLDPSIVRIVAQASESVRLDGGGSAPVRFAAEAVAAGRARIQMTVRLGSNTDAFETELPVIAPARLETSAAFGATTDRAVEKLAVPSGVLPGPGGLTIDLSSTALVGLGEGARYLADYPYGCAEQKSSSALALVLAADLGRAFSMGNIAPTEYRAKATSLLNDLPKYQCSDGGFGSWPGGCRWGQFYLTSYVLHVMKVAERHGIRPDAAVVSRALAFLDESMKGPAPAQVQWLPAWSASIAFGAKVLAEYGRPQDSNITRLYANVDRMPVFALSYLADAMVASKVRGPRYDEVLRRISNALRVEGDRAHVEELDTDELYWLWNSNVRATALVLNGFVERGDSVPMVEPLVRGLLGARVNGRWRNTQENATALEALVNYYHRFETEIPDMTATVAVGARNIGNATFKGRSTISQQVRVAMPELLKIAAADALPDLAISRTGTGRVYYTARLQYVPIDPPPAADNGMRVERRFERFVEDGESPAATTFQAGDLVRVTLAITLPNERRFVAVTDALAGGFEAVDGWFATTASDLARDASSQPEDSSFEARWRRGGFDRVEKYDDRVVLFATRLSEGRHEFSYLVRATSAGTFTAAGTYAEEMYAPEVFGRADKTTIVVR
jgi:uncharacterized protein YfaS (alpha-2-macroglobulin family)